MGRSGVFFHGLVCTCMYEEGACLVDEFFVGCFGGRIFGSDLHVYS